MQFPASNTINLNILTMSLVHHSVGCVLLLVCLYVLEKKDGHIV